MGKVDVMLLQAIQQQDSALACALVDQMPNVHFQHHYRHTALHSCVQYNVLDVAAHVLENDGNVMLMPKKMTHANQGECAVLMALKMGPSREAMQVLLLRAVTHSLLAESIAANAACLSKWTAYEHKKISLLPHYAMMWGTPASFFAAIEHDGNANPLSTDNMTPLMALLRNMVTFESDVETCRERMQYVLEIAARHPDILWQRYSDKEWPAPHALHCHLQECTPLGIMVYERLPLRIACNAAEQASYLADNGNTAPYSDSIKRSCTVIDFFQSDAIPQLWGVMMQHMRTALGMATHHRLGSNEHCAAKVLGADEMNMIFDMMMKHMTDEERHFMLC